MLLQTVLDDGLEQCQELNNLFPRKISESNKKDTLFFLKGFIAILYPEIKRSVKQELMGS